MKQHEDLLNPECRPVAAALFMSNATRIHCNFHRLCQIIVDARKICPLIKVDFVQQSGGLYSRVVYLTLVQMHHAGFAEWNDADDRLIVKRDRTVFAAFVAELNKIPRFNTVRVKELFRAAGKYIACSVYHDIPPVRPI